jgi:hypothetical protein
MSEAKSHIDLIPLSEEQITQGAVDYSELWMIKVESGEIYGPYETEALKSYAALHQHLFENAMAYNLGNETWKSFFKVAKFQRRKPKLVPIQSLVLEDNFLILFNGEKKGPFSISQVEKFVESKKIPLNVQVSLDNGESWIKLYEHHHFDRRLKKNPEDLPFLPEQKLFEINPQVLQNKLQEAQKKQEEQDALVGLAFISNGNDQGQMVDQSPSEQNNKSQEKIVHKVQFRSLPEAKTDNIWWAKIKEKVNFKYVGLGTVSLLVVFTAFNSFNATFNNGDSDIGPVVKKEAPTNPASINNSQRIPASIPAHDTQEQKILRAKKFEPNVEETWQQARPNAIQRRPNAQTERPTYNRKNLRRPNNQYAERYQEVHHDEDALKEELTRELASSNYGDNLDDDLTAEQKEFIEKASQEGFSESEMRQLDMHDTPAYEHQVDDFE